MVLKKIANRLNSLFCQVTKLGIECDWPSSSRSFVENGTLVNRLSEHLLQTERLRAELNVVGPAFFAFAHLMLDWIWGLVFSELHDIGPPREIVAF